MSNETILHSVLDGLNVAVVLTDEEHDRIHFANRAFLQLIGRGDSGLKDDRVSILDFVDPADRLREAPQRALLSQGKIQGYTIRKRYLRSDGTRVWADVTIRAIHDATGHRDGVVRTIAEIAADGAAPASSVAADTRQHMHDTQARPDTPAADVAAALRAMLAAPDVPSRIRTAARLILDNSGTRLELAEIAGRSGTSIRSLQRAFARHGMSVARVMKLVRLRRARALLLASDAATSVTAVAFLCGFTNLGHFARDYRAAFGELPSGTLHRGRIDCSLRVSSAEYR